MCIILSNELFSLHRLSDVDAGWALGVAGLAVFIIDALCLMAKCKLSLFTRWSDVGKSKMLVVNVKGGGGGVLWIFGLSAARMSKM